MDKILKAKKMLSDLDISNKNPVYNSMLYWSQKSHEVCDVLLSVFSKKGDVIFDPFMGSGVTVIEAVSDDYCRNAIGCEINLPPIKLVEAILKKYNLREVLESLDLFIEDIKKLLSEYEITCPVCGQKATITSTLFDFKDNQINPKKINIKCSCGNKLANDYSYVKNKMNNKRNFKYVKDIPLIYNSRIAVEKGQHIFKIFTYRNLYCLDQILALRETKYSNISNIIDYILLGVIHLCKITDTHSNSQWPLWIPTKDCVEKNIVPVFERKITAVKKALQYSAEHYKKLHNSNAHKKLSYRIINKPIQFLSEKDIPKESVDLVITDPPYLGQVLYSEYMQLFKPFVKFDIDMDNEIVVSSGENRNKTEDRYFSLMKEAFIKIAGTMKENSYMCMYFHDHNLEVWTKLIETLSDCNLRYITQQHINKRKKTIKNILSPKKSLIGDAILFFVKDSNESSYKKSPSSLSIEIIEHNILEEAKNIVIQMNNEASTPELYDSGIMEILIQNNWLPKLSSKYSSLVDIFQKGLVWNEENSKWLIPKTKSLKTTS